MDWSREFFGNTLTQWATALAVVVLITVALRLAFRVLVSRLKALSRRTQNDLDDLAVELLSKTRTLFVALIALYVGSRPLTLPDAVNQWLEIILHAGIILQIGFWGMGIVNYAVHHYKARELEEDPGFATAVGAMGFVVRLALWAVLLLTFLKSAMDVDITAFVASLGIGGVAVALALQNVLGDLFASMSIVLDKPFVIGDFIVVGDFAGTVEHVGLKTTRIRSLSGEQLVFSNSDLLGSRIRNYKRMEERRVVFEVGVVYGTPPEDLRLIPGLVREAVESQDNTRFDRSHLKAFGGSSLDFETVYYMTVPDYNAYMDTQQAINLALYEAFGERDIEFAFPTQTVFVQRVAQADSSGDESREAAEVGGD